MKPKQDVITEDQNNKQSVRRLPIALEQKIEKIKKRELRKSSDSSECSAYHDWDNGGYSIYNDRG